MLECCYYTVKTQIIGLCAMSLELPPLVTSVFLFYFLSPKGAEQLCFCCVFSPILRWEPSRSNPKELLQNTTPASQGHLFTEVSNEARARVWSNILEAHINTNSVHHSFLYITPFSSFSKISSGALSNVFYDLVWHRMGGVYLARGLFLPNMSCLSYRKPELN